MNTTVEMARKYDQPDIAAAANKIETFQPASSDQEAAIMQQLQQFPPELISKMSQAGHEPPVDMMVPNYLSKTKAPVTFPSPNAITDFMVNKMGLPDMQSARAGLSGTTPSMEANAAKEYSIGKFISPSGEVKIGPAAELDLQKIGMPQDLLANPEDFKVNPDQLNGLLNSTPKSLGIYRSKAGELFNKTYLPTQEGIAHGIDYESNPLISIVKQYIDASKKVAFSKSVQAIS